MQKTTVMLVRHGEAQGNITRHFHGFYNSTLTENGMEQIKRLAQRLKEYSIDVLYSSDLKRAYETAYEIAKIKNLNIHISERFREINGGQWEGVPWDDLPLLFPESYDHWLSTPHKLQMPGGESMQEFQARLIHAIHEAVDKHPGKKICIATHGTAIRVLACYFYGKPLTELTSINWCDNASITIAQHQDAHFQMIADGDNTHLQDISTLAQQDWWKQ